jgi:hypothetical protein
MYANRPERDRRAPMSLTTSDSTPVFADAAAYTASVPEESSLDREGWRPSGLLEWFAIGQTLLPALLFVPGNQPFRAAIRASAFLISLVTFFYWYFNRRLRPTAKHPAERWLSLAAHLGPRSARTAMARHLCWARALSRASFGSGQGTIAIASGLKLGSRTPMSRNT